MAEKERNDANTGKSEGKQGHGKRILLRTFGCQMNEYDSELIRAILTEAGFRLTDDACEADVILLNTCSVRENAVRKIRGHIHQIRHDRQGRPAVYGILGCVATHLKEDILNDRHLNIDLTAGPDSYRRLPELIQKCVRTLYGNSVGTLHCNVPTKAYDITLSTDETYEDIYPLRDSAANAWVAIMRGCNNFCSYCVVPYTRGRERSRSASGIVSEVRRLVCEGFSQVTLLGQNVNSYSHDGVDFPKLLSMVSAVKGLKRIWFTSPHPKDFPDRLIDLIASDPKICKHIHLPLQSGSSAILKKMNRPYTKTQYLALVKKIRSRCPQIALTTDIIVGFPGETDQDFQDTVDVFQKTGYDSAFIFKYSPRQGTAAARLLDDVSEDAKISRIVLLNALQKETALIKNQAFTGTTQDHD